MSRSSCCDLDPDGAAQGGQFLGAGPVVRAGHLGLFGRRLLLLPGGFDLVAGAGQLLVAHRSRCAWPHRAACLPAETYDSGGDLVDAGGGPRHGLEPPRRWPAGARCRRPRPPPGRNRCAALSSSPLIARTAAAARSMVRIASSSGDADGSAVRAASISASRPPRVSMAERVPAAACSPAAICSSSAASRASRRRALAVVPMYSACGLWCAPSWMP